MPQTDQEVIDQWLNSWAASTADKVERIVFPYLAAMRELSPTTKNKLVDVIYADMRSLTNLVVGQVKKE